MTRLLGSDMQAKLAPQSDEERMGLEADEAELDWVLTVEDMVRSADCAFIATGVTANPLLPAPEQTAWGWRTHRPSSPPRPPASSWRLSPARSAREGA